MVQKRVKEHLYLTKSVVSWGRSGITRPIKLYTCIQCDKKERVRVRLQSEPSYDAVRRVCRCEKYIDFPRGRVYNNGIMLFVYRFCDFGGCYGAVG